MKVCMVTQGSLNSTWQENLSKISNFDVVVFGFNGLGLVSYKKELNGKTEYFHDLARLSKQLSCVVISGLDTDTYGVFRHSVVIADHGKILGVSDMVHSTDHSEFVSGVSLGIFQTSVGKIGVLVDDDLMFPENTKTLCACDADIIVCVMQKLDCFMPQTVARALSYCYGVAMVLCSTNYGALSNIRGDIVSASYSDLVKVQIKIEKDYHSINVKRRGLISLTDGV